MARPSSVSDAFMFTSKRARTASPRIDTLRAILSAGVSLFRIAIEVI
jgi:hypothetical protein